VTEAPRPSRPERIGRYKVLDRIGRGAMGVVYSAHDELMDREVAVKVMMTDLEGEPDIRARFLREAQVSAGLAHRNIVTIYDIGEDNGRLFIVMELLRGHTLDRALKERSFAIEEKVDLTIDVCDGLAIANAAGVCHRDVKPGNLFVQAEGGVKILDFGIARLASSSMTASGFIVGTPDYMSPEQARGTTVDARSDIFSLGAVLYFMLSGRKPFVAPDLPAVLHKVVSEEPPPLQPAEAPAALARVVLKALAKNPDERFQKFSDFASELSRWRRRYEAETRSLAEAVAREIDGLASLADEERLAAEALGIPTECDVEGALAQIASTYPHLQANGADSLRSGQWHRRDVDEVAKRTGAIAGEWETRVDGLRAALGDLGTATECLARGDAHAALAAFERVQNRVPSAAIAPLMDRARHRVAEQQARDERVRSLLAEADTASAGARFEAALALVNEALAAHPESLQAKHALDRVQGDLAAAEANRIRQCERCLDRARRALQANELEEAERQLQLALETGAANPDIATVRTALSEARTARETAGALVQEIAGELALARGEFQGGKRDAAIERLQSLTVRHPSSGAAAEELARLRAEHDRLTAAERTLGEADVRSADAASALDRGELEIAVRLAEEALELLPSHEMALRTAAIAHARLRENAERTARQQRAAELVKSAQAFLAGGKYERAIKEAQRAAELDPLATAAHSIVAEGRRRLADAASTESIRQQAVKRAIEVHDLLESAASALRRKDFAAARGSAERALALDPGNDAPRELIAKIATAAALSTTALEDDTVDLHASQVDPDATAVLRPIKDDDPGQKGWTTSLWDSVSAACGAAVAKLRRAESVPAKPAGVERRASGDTRNKEA
jgi:tetratricopeptide (TPR) repeat protein/predicted Ser/Thr protein kinase